jgi:acyl-coenzyme A thioesterase PaaI-like protein
MTVHGGVIPLFFDWHFGMIVSAAGRPISRTAYLHVDYRKITPIDDPLVSRGRIDSIDGRKAFVSATMTDSDGTVLSEASGLMIRPLPHQP